MKLKARPIKHSVGIIINKALNSFPPQKSLYYKYIQSAAPTAATYAVYTAPVENKILYLLTGIPMASCVQSTESNFNAL